MAQVLSSFFEDHCQQRVLTLSCHREKYTSLRSCIIYHIMGGTIAKLPHLKNSWQLLIHIPFKIYYSHVGNLSFSSVFQYPRWKPVINWILQDQSVTPQLSASVKVYCSGRDASALLSSQSCSKGRLASSFPRPRSFSCPRAVSGMR